MTSRYSIFIAAIAAIITIVVLAWASVAPHVTTQPSPKDMSGEAYAGAIMHPSVAPSYRLSADAEDKKQLPIRPSKPDFDILSNSSHNYSGYIVRFKKAPVIEYAAQLSVSKDVVGQATQVYSSRAIKLYASQLSSEHMSARISMAQSIGIPVASFNGKVQGEYKKTFNGMALRITDIEAQALKNNPYVADVYPNYQVHATLMDSVPMIGADKLWKMNAAGDACINAGGSGECLTGKGIRIAIIDTGVDYTHPDLGGCLGNGCKVAGGYDFVNNDADPMDDQGHGTHVAATAAGNGALKGVAPDATIYAYKVLDSYGSGYESAIISGIERAADPNNDGDTSDHLDILSMSLGGPGDADDPMSSAVDAAVDAGVIAVIAAGNDGPYTGTVASPGTARSAITVGATDKNGAMASFSSRGPTHSGTIKPDVVAPGVNICAAQSSQDTIWQIYKDMDDIDIHCLDDKHMSISGTSMATPHVAGAAALLKQAHKGWSPAEMKNALRSSSRDLGDDANAQGTGFVQLDKAVRLSNVPVAYISVSGAVKSPVDIIGSAYASNFTGYILEYKPLGSASWTMLKQSKTPVKDGLLYAGLDLPDQVIELRLIVSSNLANSSYGVLLLKKPVLCTGCEDCTFKAMFAGSEIVLSNDIVVKHDDYNASSKVYISRCITLDAGWSNPVQLDCNGHSIKNDYVNVSTQTRYFDSTAIYPYGRYKNVKNCQLYNFTHGISADVWMSTIYNNSFYNNDFGVLLACAYNDTLSENRFYDSKKQSIWVTTNIFCGYSPLYRYHNIDTTNTINGLPIYYYFNISNVTLKGLHAAQLQLHYSNNVRVQQSDMLYEGIVLKGNNNLVMTENNITFRSEMPASGESSHVIFSKNIFSATNDMTGLILSQNLFTLYVDTQNVLPFEDLSFSGNTFKSIIIDVAGARNVSMSANKFYDSNIILTGSSTPYIDAVFSSNILSNSSYWMHGSELIFENNTISNEDHVYNSIMTSNSTIRSNTFRGDISVQCLDNVSIYDNTFLHGSLRISNWCQPWIVNAAIYENRFLQDINYSIIYGNGCEYGCLLNLSKGSHGNYWGHPTQPYYCRYGDNSAACINNWDGSDRWFVDPCPYNQSYPAGKWPDSPVCKKSLPACSDSDGGRNYSVKGRSKGLYWYNGDPNQPVFESYDYCGCINGDCSKTGLWEYYCKNSTVLAKVAVECECMNGACIGPKNSCTDTDGGKNYLAKGTAYGTASGVRYSYTDYCSSAGNLREYFCDSGAVASTSRTCARSCNAYGCTAYGCYDGRCVN